MKISSAVLELLHVERIQTDRQTGGELLQICVANRAKEVLKSSSKILYAVLPLRSERMNGIHETRS